jgi:hypothetical protein
MAKEKSRNSFDSGTEHLLACVRGAFDRSNGLTVENEIYQHAFEKMSYIFI